MRAFLLSVPILAGLSLTAVAQLVVPPKLDDRDLVASALRLCISPAAKTATEFEAAAKRKGFTKVGEARGGKVRSYENAAGHMGSLKITALSGKPGLFECRVSSGRLHEGLRPLLEASLTANFDGVSEFAMTNGWIFRKDGREYVVGISTIESIPTTAVTVSVDGVFK
ncbi:hypothetical protein [Vannielia litorea]|uniref:hypothetical protein n=1 Tax=Vannielia litorea TaxID=1217970 RepID=UPI001BCE9D38|nr:hypothetical protein [Vannielia litorea]MBS8226933.1 hypothetical protein [Vannielia litorea]